MMLFTKAKVRKKKEHVSKNINVTMSNGFKKEKSKFKEHYQHFKNYCEGEKR